MKFLSLIFVFLASNAFADVVNPLPKGDALGGIAKAMGRKLSDENIASGTTQLWAGKLKRSAQFEEKQEFQAFVAQAFVQAYKEQTSESLPAGAKVVANVHSFVDGDAKNGDVYKMTSALMESNDYAENKENRDQQARSLWAVLRKLPVGDRTLVGHVTTTVKDDSSDPAEDKSVQYFLLVNKDGKVVQFFTVEGHM